MNAYNLFTYSVSKYSLTKLEDIIKVEQVGLRLNENGSNLGRTIQMCTNLQTLVDDFLDKLPLAAKDPQIEIGNDYNKICSLYTLLQENILLHDQIFQSNQCTPHFNKLLNILNDIGKYIQQLTTSQSSSKAQYFDGLNGNLTSVFDLYGKIITTAKKCETELSSEIPPIPDNERQISHQIAATLFTFEELLIQLYFFSTNSDVQKSDNYPKLQEFIQKVPEYRQTLLQTQLSDEQQLTTVLIDLFSEMANLSTILSKIQAQIPESSDFSNLSVTLVTLMQFLNETETKITTKYVQKISEELSNFYLEKKPLNPLIETAKTVLANIGAKIEKNFFYSSSPFVVSSYRSLSNFIEKVDDEKYEMKAIFLSSVVRLWCQVFSDSRTGEEILVSLLVQISSIMKILFIESNHENTEMNHFISKNLEKLDLSKLNETNYFLTAALNANNPDIDSDDFVSAQQLFFVSFSGLPIPLSKLASSCSSETVKAKLNDFVSDIQKVADSFSNWFNQFYLTVFSIIHFRSEMLVGSLSFPLLLLHSSDLHDIQHFVSEIRKINEMSPQIITGNICDVTGLVENIIEISKSGNDYVKCIRLNAESSFFPIYKMSVDAIAQIIVDIPQYMLSLGQDSLFDNSQIFIASLLASASVSLRFMSQNESFVDSCEPMIYQVLSPSFTFASFVCHFIEMNPQESVELPPLMSVVRESMRSLISALTSVEKVTNISENFNAFKKATSDLLLSVLQHKQPSLHYDIPDDVQQFRHLDSMSTSLQSSGLQSFAHFVLSVTKDANSSNVNDFRNKWFDATQEGIVNITKGIAQFKGEISKLLSDSQISRSSFVRSISSLSVSLASNESNYDKFVCSSVSELHRKLVSNSCDFLKDPNDHQSKLMRIHCCITEIASLLDISKLKEKEKDNFLASILKRAIVSLNIIRQKSDTCDLNDKLSAIDSIEELFAFSQVNNVEKVDLNDLLEKTVSGELSKPILDQFISTFSEQLLKLTPSQFSLLDSITDTDSVLDFLYDKSEEFGDNINSVFQHAKSREKTDKDKISASLNSMLLSASDASLLVNHSIKLGGFDKTTFSATFVSTSTKLFTALRQFCDTSFKICENQEADFLPDLRKINRRMSAQFDVFINTVEDPNSHLNDRECDDDQKTIEFKEKKCSCCSDISSVIVHVLRLLALSSRSLVTEMYDKERGEIEANINSSIDALQNSIDSVVSEAIGANPSDFSELTSHLRDKTKSLLNVSENLTFGPPSLASYPLMQPIEDFLSEANKIGSSVMILTNKIIIVPDPIASSRVPDDKALPHPPKEATLTMEQSIAKLLESQKNVQTSLTHFKSVVKDEFTSSDEIVSSIIDLRESSDTFVDSALLVSVATVNPLYQVEQQTSLHAFVNSLNGLQNSTKSRLMRSINFASNMADSISLFESSLNKTVETAEQSSADDGVDGDQAVDDVTRELNAAANVIDMMSKRLKEIEGQVNLEAFKGEDEFDEKSASTIDNIEAAADSLPAYLIAAADPILSSTSQILQKAKQVTTDLLKKFGKIENERGLINTAQNLSEAAELLLVCAEILVSGKDNSAEFKAITAARIINAAVAEFQCQVLQKLGADEGEIKGHINNVKKFSNSIVLRGEAIVAEKLNRSYENTPKKKMIFQRRLEQDTIVANCSAKLEMEEKLLKEFRYQQHRNYHSPVKEKKT